MELADLHFLVAAAETGNFTSAARKLGLRTSTISRRIARLEDELGLTLFERGSAGVRLTTGGSWLLCHTKAALAEIDALKREGMLRGLGMAGRIRLGCRIPPTGRLLRELLVRWRDLHPQVSLVIAEMNERDIAAALDTRRLDAALIPSFAVRNQDGALAIYRERLVLAAPVDHRFSRGGVVNWNSLQDELILCQGWDDSQAQREFYASLVGKGAHFQSHAASSQSIFALVGAGFGLTLALESQSETPFSGVFFRQIDEPDAWVNISIAWHVDLKDPAVGCFVAFLRDAVYSRQRL